MWIISGNSSVSGNCSFEQLPETEVCGNRSLWKQKFVETEVCSWNITFEGAHLFIAQCQDVLISHLLSHSIFFFILGSNPFHQGVYAAIFY